MFPPDYSAACLQSRSYYHKRLLHYEFSTRHNCVYTLLMHRQTQAPNTSHTHTSSPSRITHTPFCQCHTLPPPYKMTQLKAPVCIVSLYQLFYTPDWPVFGIFLCNVRATLVFPASGKMLAISMK